MRGLRKLGLNVPLPPLGSSIHFRLPASFLPVAVIVALHHPYLRGDGNCGLEIIEFAVSGDVGIVGLVNRLFQKWASYATHSVSLLSYATLKIPLVPIFLKLILQDFEKNKKQK